MLTVVFDIILFIQHILYRKNNVDTAESAEEKKSIDDTVYYNKELGKSTNITMYNNGGVGGWEGVGGADISCWQRCN